MFNRGGDLVPEELLEEKIMHENITLKASNKEKKLFFYGILIGIIIGIFLVIILIEFINSIN